jgi:hypothetical protein
MRVLAVLMEGRMPARKKQTKSPRKSKRSKKNDRIPSWLENALQGITFWIGHRRAVYRHHELTEGAIVGELSNLIQANLRDQLRLSCEVDYTSLWTDGVIGSNLKGKRADLVVYDKSTNKKGEEFLVIEVKRSTASKAHINHDLARLSDFKLKNRGVHTFLIIVSQARKPRRFVSPTGRAKQIQVEGVRARVRRVCSASSSLKRGDSSHYAVAVEVL